MKHPQDTQQLVPMGYIKGAFGIKGWIRVHVDTEYADSLLDYPEWLLDKDGETVRVSVESGKVSGDGLQVKLAAVDDRDAAARLRGYTVNIPRSAFAPAGEDEFYWADLVGMSVRNREGVLLGEVRNLMQTGAHDVLVVAGECGEKLIPFVSQYIDTVEAENRTITVDWGIDY